MLLLLFLFEMRTLVEQQKKKKTSRMVYFRRFVLILSFFRVLVFAVASVLAVT